MVEVWRLVIVARRIFGEGGRLFAWVFEVFVCDLVNI